MNPSRFLAKLLIPTSLTIAAVIAVPGVYAQNPHSPKSALKYFGYYGGAMEGVGKGNYIQEISNHANISWIRGSDDIEKLRQTSERGMFAVLEIPRVLFDEKAALFPDYKERWRKYAELVAPYIKSVAAIYPADEPFWWGPSVGTSQTDMKRQLETVTAMVRSTFPGVPLAMTFTVQNLNQLEHTNFVPKGFDWFGVDCYGSWDNCQGGSMPSHLSRLKKHMTKNQRIMLIADSNHSSTGKSSPSESDQRKVVDRMNRYYDFAVSDPAVIGIFPFIYQSFDEREKHFTGASEMPLVLKRCTEIGQSILNGKKLERSEPTSQRTGPSVWPWAQRR